MITFRKLYAIPKEGEYWNAIVSYHKHPLLLTRKPAESTGMMMRPDDFVNQYEKQLRIDLWIVILDFEWKTKFIEECL